MALFRSDLQRLARLRLAEAKVLLKAKLYAGAYHVAGFTIECALKARVARNMCRYQFPDKKTTEKLFTHALADLALQQACPPVALREKCGGNLEIPRRFTLMGVINEKRLLIWRQQPGAFFAHAIVVVLRKELAIERNGQQVGDEVRYFFDITNERGRPAAAVYFAKDRCNQENLIEQLKNGVRGLTIKRFSEALLTRLFKG
jgi:hypothetical protein